MTQQQIVQYLRTRANDFTRDRSLVRQMADEIENIGAQPPDNRVTETLEHARDYLLSLPFSIDAQGIVYQINQTLNEVTDR